MIPVHLRRPATSRPDGRLLVAILLVAALATGCGPASSTPAPAASSPGTSILSPSPPGLVPGGPTEAANVIRIVDGDTIVIDRGRGNERLRYIGINAPESVKPDTPVEFMGHEASAANKALVEGRDVVIEKDVSEVDQYGRLLRYVWIRDGESWIFVNLELVRRGFAQAVTYPPDVRWIDVLREGEREARAAGAGLWGEPTPAP